MVLVCWCLSISQLWGQVQFSYQHYEEQKYHILAQVSEQVLRNRQLVYNTQILNRIAVDVVAITDQDASLNVHYQISEQAEDGRYFSWGLEHQAQFEMSSQGIYKNVRPGATIPSLRNVPSFPRRELKEGEGWNAAGIEIQDLEPIFNIPARLRFDFIADYLYRGEKLFEGRKLEHITVIYRINEDIRKQLPSSFASRSPKDQAPQDIPQAVRAQHNIELYWDSQRGLPVYQKEDFEISYLLQSEDEVTFRGRSRGRIVEVEPMRHQNLKQELEKDLRAAGLDAKVEQTEKGISISVDSIHFYPNSERMLPGEERKLKQMSRILQKYPKRDVLITGHTADLGQPEQQQKLSEKRAATVGQFLIQNGIRRREQVVIRGVGGTEPIVSNATEQGRQQNRRVEITLLEN